MWELLSRDERASAIMGVGARPSERIVPPRFVCSLSGFPL